MAYCSSYYLYQRYEMRGGQEPIPSYPNVYSIDGEGSMPLRTRAMYDEDCGYMPDVQTIYRWNKAPSTQWECVGFDKHYIEYYQYSNDGGITWQNVEPVSSRTSSSVIEYNSQDCNYVPPTPQPEYRWTVITPTTDPSTYWCDNCPYGAMYRWNKAPVSDYECVGKDKHYKEYYQVSYDGGETWSNVVPTTSRTSSDVIEYNSQSCGGSTPTGYKLLMYYDHEAPYEVPCDSSTTLTSSDVFINQRDRDELSSAVIGNCITTIGEDAFYNATSLTSITIPSSVTTIGNINSFYQGSFGECYGLQSVVIPDSVTTIGKYVFKDCYNLTSVKLPSGITAIGDNYGHGVMMFLNCYKLSSIGPIGSGASVELPNSVTTIGYGAFDSCSGLTSVTLPNSVTTIGGQVFAYCTSLRNINIPDSVTSIGGGGFVGCSGLTSVTIGSGITSIGSYAFSDCSGLTSITVNATTPPALDTTAFNNTNNCPIYVPCASVNAYVAAGGWSDYASRIYGIPGRVM